MLRHHTIPCLNNPFKKKHFENILGKEENAGYQHFLLFPQFFYHLSSLPSYKVIDWPTIKAFAVDKLKGTKMMMSSVVWVENIMGKRRKSWLPAFLLFSTIFHKAFSSELLKVRILW